MEHSAARNQQWVKLEQQFHLQTAQASHNKLFFYIINPLADFLVNAFIKGLSRNAPEGILEGITSYMGIIESIRKGDGQEAEVRIQVPHPQLKRIRYRTAIPLSRR